MIKRTHIQQFLAIVETGSFTHAAQRLRVTQPTLSLGIAEMERLCGGRLFVRSRRQVRLTDAGARFLPIARELHRGFRAADAFGNTAKVDWPEVKLGIIKTLAPTILHHIIKVLSREFTLEIIEGSDSEVRSALSNGRVDLTIGLCRQGEQSETELLLFEEPYVLLTSENHRLAHKEEVEMDDLASEIMIARRSCEALDQTSRIFTSHGVRPRFAFRSESDERCLILVERGIGVTTAPRSFVRPRLCALSVKEYNISRQIGLRVDPKWMKSSNFLIRDIGKEIAEFNQIEI